MAGKVYIVGAGPGTADLLTVRAVRLLSVADVVLHDDLVPQEVLQLARPSAQVVNVGKRRGRHEHSQEQINALLLWHAGNGKTVVRLKSGDPAIFGRLGEELDALRRAGVEAEVVPGVTAASAAAAEAGIALTDRRVASSMVFLTAHNCRNESLARTRLDPAHTTYAVYMPGPDYGRTARELIECGLHAETPCALVTRAGRANQRVCFITLADLPFVTGVASPALLIVGKVAQTRDASLWRALWHDRPGQPDGSYPPAMDGTSVISSPSLNR